MESISNIKDNINELNLIEAISDFKKLGINLNKSPSNDYFLKIFNKIYGQICLDITNNLLEKISQLKNNPNNDELKNNAKIFLYAYIIVINHHEIFGFNNRLERVLVQSSLDMLYIFLKLCDKIYKNKLSRIEDLLNKFIDKYHKYYKYYKKWRRRDAEELLDILTYSYYQLNHNLSTINENNNEFESLSGKIEEIEDKIQFLLLDNTKNKMIVKEFIESKMSKKKMKEICNKSERHFIDIQLYNMDNGIKIGKSLKEILGLIEKRINYLEKKYELNINWSKSDVANFCECLENKNLDFEVYSNKYFLKTIYYLMDIMERINEKIIFNKTSIQNDIHKSIVDKKYKKFLKNFMKKSYEQVIPEFFRNYFEKIDTFP